MDIFQAVCLSTTILIVWFETDAFVAYLTTFNLGWQMFDLAKYEEESDKNPMIDYPTYLLMSYPKSFFIKLLSCPLCLGLWISVLSVLIFGVAMVNIPIVYVLSLLLFFLTCKLYR